MKTKIAMIVVIALGALQASGDSFTDCYRMGVDSGIGSYLVKRVCRGATNTGPVECFIAAQQTGQLDTDESIRFCRCARSARSATCLKEMLRQPGAGWMDALLSCGDPNKKTPEEQACLNTD